MEITVLVINECNNTQLKHTRRIDRAGFRLNALERLWVIVKVISNQQEDVYISS